MLSIRSPSTGDAGLSEADFADTGILLAFGGSTEIQAGIISEDLGLQVCAPGGV